MSGNGGITEDELRVLDRLREDIRDIIRSRIDDIGLLHVRAIKAGYEWERKVHDKVEQLLADVISMLEDAGFKFDPDMVEGVLRKLGQNWLAHVREYIPV
jgi:DNA polymerase I-like protein with 3'-5' exonuclease and polymerase domains